MDEVEKAEELRGVEERDWDRGGGGGGGRKKRTRRKRKREEGHLPIEM